MTQLCNLSLVLAFYKVFLQDRTFRAMSNYLRLGFRFFSPRFRDTFQLSLTILVCYRTLEIFRVGCQCHPDSCSIFKEQYLGYLAFPFSPSSTRLSLFSALLSRRLRVDKLGKTQVLQLHIFFCSSQKNSVYSLSLSFAITNDISIDFSSYGY